MTKKANGLKTEVKYGVLTPALAREAFEQMARETGYRSKRFDNWLRRYEECNDQAPRFDKS